MTCTNPGITESAELEEERAAVYIKGTPWWSAEGTSNAPKQPGKKLRESSLR